MAKDLDASVWRNIRNPHTVVTEFGYPVYHGVLQNHVIGHGMCGYVHPVHDRPDLVAKVYYDHDQHDYNTAVHEAKMLERVGRLDGFNGFKNHGPGMLPILYMKRIHGVPLIQTRYYRTLHSSQRPAAIQEAQNAVHNQVMNHVRLHGVLYNLK